MTKIKNWTKKKTWILKESKKKNLIKIVFVLFVLFVICFVWYKKEQIIKKNLLIFLVLLSWNQYTFHSRRHREKRWKGRKEGKKGFVGRCTTIPNSIHWKWYVFCFLLVNVVKGNYERCPEHFYSKMNWSRGLGKSERK